MYPKTASQILMPDDFFIPFGGKLNSESRWVKLAVLILWWELEERYAKHFKLSRRGEEALTVRVAPRNPDYPNTFESQ